MTKMRQGERCLGGDRGLQMTNMRMSASSVTAYLGPSLSARNFLPVHLPICLSTVCWVTVCLGLSVSLSVCLSVSSLQSNVTLNVISFLSILSLLNLRFQQSINNHIVKVNRISLLQSLAEIQGGNILII